MGIAVLAKRAVKREDATSNVFQNASLRRVGLAQFSALAAIYALYFASVVLIEDVTHSSGKMGLLIAAFTLPGFIVGMLAGVFVDWYDRRRALVAAHVLGILVATSFAIATHWVDNLTALLLVVLVSNLLLSAIQQFTSSARDAIVPRAVRSMQLLAANSILQVVMLGAQAAGMVLLAPLLIHLGGASATGLAALPLFAIAAVVYARLPAWIGRIKSNVAPRTISSMIRDLRDGWAFVADHAAVRRAIGCLVLISVLTLVLMTLLPGFAARVWGVPVETMIYLAIPGGVGFGAGVWLVGRRGDMLATEAWINIGLLGIGVGLVLLSSMQALYGFSLLLFLVISFMTGGSFALVMIPARTLVQERSPDEMRGRVISTQFFLCNAASAVPLPLMGGLADTIGFRYAFLAIAVVVLVAGLIHARSSRRWTQ
jgi:MFS family permease